MMASEAREQKITEADRVANALALIAEQRAKEIAAWLIANPEVGTLNRGGEAVYYVYPAGGQYTEVAALTKVGQ